MPSAAAGFTHSTPSLAALARITNSAVTDQTNVVSSLSGATLTTIPLWAITAITGATTATINVYHTLGDSGGGNYTLTLPAAGTVGQRMSFYALTGLTEIVTIDGNAAETIDGAATYKMAANDYLLLEYDGTNWRIINTKGLVSLTARSDAGQSLTANTTNLQYEDDIVDSHSAFSGNDSFTAPRTATYLIGASFAVTGANQPRLLAYIDASAAGIVSAERQALAGGSVTVAFILKLSVGEVFTLRSNLTETRTTTASENWISIKEIF